MNEKQAEAMNEALGRIAEALEEISSMLDSMRQYNENTDRSWLRVCGEIDTYRQE